MKKSFSGTLVVIGSLLVIAPIIYKYLTYRLIVEIMIQRNAVDANFNGDLPYYYIPACLVIGAICIGLGIIFEIKDRNVNKPF